MGMPKYDRLLYILNLLRSRKTLNASRLAEECGVTERSIYRDIISLSEANIPIYYDNGYKLATDNFLPPLNFTLEEYSTIKMALESTPLQLDSDKARLIKQAKAKIEAGLSELTRKKRRTSVDASLINIDTSQTSQQSAKYYSAIERAISERLIIQLDYESIEHGRSTRKVEPYFIIFKGHAFYFVAFCRKQKEFRTFRIDRVRKLTVSEESFARRNDIRAETYFEDSWRIYSGQPVDVEIRFTGASARVIAGGEHHPKEEKERIDDDTLIYRVRVKGMVEILRWILGFQDEAEVLKPQSLRNEIKKAVDRMKKLYEAKNK